MITLIVAIACFVGGWYAHKTKWHLKAINEGQEAFETFKEEVQSDE
jgi:hypothetical protein